MPGPINYQQRLESLKKRRSIPAEFATDRIAAKAMGAAQPAILRESYEQRTKKESTQYALGCMQEMAPRATEISIEEGERVKSQLQSKLNSQGLYPQFQYQGSVPLNIHIEFSSDIDLLVICGDILSYDVNGTKAGTYRPVTRTVVEAVTDLRTRCEGILAATYYAAKVDCSGEKSITLSEGSFRRKVDVVPSAWFDTQEYQLTGIMSDRIVQILEKSKQLLLHNWPFRHMEKINEKDKQTVGGCKKVIRLLKSIKRDSTSKNKISGYEIAGLVWHFPVPWLSVSSENEILLVPNTYRMLSNLLNDRLALKTLKTPDSSRMIMDNDEKINALSELRDDLGEIAYSIAREHYPQFTPNDQNIGDIFNFIQIPQYSR